MFTKETVRKMCEYSYAPSLVGEILFEVDFEVRRETAEAKARRIWKMEPKGNDQT